MSGALRVLVTADVVGERPTGVALATRMLVNALRTRDDVEPSVLVDGDSPAAAWGVPVVRADWRVPGAPFVFTRHGKLEGFDIIHCSTVRVPFLGTPKGPRLVMTIHDLVPLVAPEYHTRGHRLYFRYLLARSARKFDAIVTDSEATRRDLVDRLAIEAGKISVIPLYSRWPVQAESEGRAGDFVLAVGTIEPRKNISRVVEAFLRVRVRNPELRQRLVVAGVAGWGSEAPFSGSPELMEHVEWRGYVSDAELYELYRNATVLVYPSLLEGFGLPPLEAMSLGCPVITSRRSSLPEVGGDAVMYVEPEDVGGIAQALERLVKEPELRHDLKVKGLDQAASFSPERMGEQLGQLYHTLVSAS